MTLRCHQEKPQLALNKKKQDEFARLRETAQKSLTPEKFAVWEKVYLNPDGTLDEPAVDHLTTHAMLRQDYFSSQSELNRKQAELDERQKALDTDLNNLAQYETRINEYEQYLQNSAVSRADYDAAQAELTTLRAWRDSAQGRLKELEVEGLLDGLDTSQAPSSSTSPNLKPQQNGANMPKANGKEPGSHVNGSTGSPVQYVTHAQLTQQINQNALAPVMLSAQLQDAANEYFALTGKPLENQAKLMYDGIASGKTLPEYLDEVLGLRELRTAKQKTDYEKEMTRRVEEEVSKRLTEGRLPTSQAPRDYQHSPFIQQMMTPQTGEGDVLSAKPQNRPGEAARRATEAHYQGKYANERL